MLNDIVSLNTLIKLPNCLAKVFAKRETEEWKGQEEGWEERKWGRGEGKGRGRGKRKREK